MDETLEVTGSVYENVPRALRYYYQSRGNTYLRYQKRVYLRPGVYGQNRRQQLPPACTQQAASTPPCRHNGP